MNEQVQAPQKSSGGCGKVAIGCGIAVLILVIILAVAGWLIYKNFRSIGASAFAYTVNSMVDQSTLPDDQKQTIKDKVNYVKEEFAAGNITLEEIGQAMEQLDVEKLITAGITQYIGTGLIGASELSDDQKAEGKKALNRVAYGLLEGQIDPDETNNMLAPIMEQSSSNQQQLKQNPTVEELQQVIDNANDLADQNGIPEDVGEVDFAARVSEAFDEALGIESTEPEQTP